MAPLYFLFAYRAYYPEGGFHDLVAVACSLIAAEERAGEYRRTGFLNAYEPDSPTLDLWRLDEGKRTLLRTWELRRIDGADLWRELAVGRGE